MREQSAAKRPSSPYGQHLTRAAILGIGLLLAPVLVGCGDQYNAVITVTSPTVEERGSFGWSVAKIGDVNSDGTPDAAVGAPGETVAGQPYGGQVYLVDGTDGSILTSVTSSEPKMRGFFGATVAGAGDVDGDGTADVIVGARRERVDGKDAAGRVFVISGADGTTLQTLTSPSPETEGFFGRAVDGVGDVSGDGTPDLIVGASDEAAQGKAKAGRAYLFSGADGSVLDSLDSPKAEQEGFFGTAVSGVGDVNGDGRPDVAVGAYYESVDENRRAGRAYLFSGEDGSVLSSMRSPNVQSESIFGGEIEGIGDVTGDGRPDLAIGAYYERVQDTRRAGRAYLFSGADGTALETLRSPNVGRTGLFGKSMSAIGDANQDGTPDLVVGAHGETVEGKFGAGRAYLISGADGSILRTLTSPNATKEGAFGSAVAGVGSLNTGTPAVVVGAFWETIKEKGEGRVYLFGREP